MFQTKGATLQHLKSKSLTSVSIYVHGHDGQRKLSCILHLETLSNGEEWLIGAQACEEQAAKVSRGSFVFAKEWS